MISVTYQLFIVLLTINALVVMAAYYVLPVPVEVKQVLYILDSLNAFILLGDFFYRLYRAPNRLRYLISLGWLDLLGSLPGLPILRLARVPTLAARVPMPGWLQIDSPDELEGSLISVTVVVLAVNFLGVVVTPSQQINTLQYGAGIALPIAALALFVGLRAFAKWMSHKTAEHEASGVADEPAS